MKLTTLDGAMGIYKAVYEAPGVYIFTCTAIDSHNLEASANLTVTVYSGKKTMDELIKFLNNHHN